jgi:hypothetical protein
VTNTALGSGIVALTSTRAPVSGRLAQIGMNHSRCCSSRSSVVFTSVIGLCVTCDILDSLAQPACSTMWAGPLCLLQVVSCDLEQAQ